MARKDMTGREERKGREGRIREMGGGRNSREKEKEIGRKGRKKGNSERKMEKIKD